MADIDDLGLVPLPAHVELTLQSTFRPTAETHILAHDKAAKPVADHLAAALDTMLDLRLAVNAQPSPAAARTVDAANGTVIELAIDSEGADANPASEAYHLTVSSDGARVIARSAAGLFWGIHTLVQLISGHRDAGIPSLVIHDRPRYEYRGAMLDVARHFFTVDEVKRYIDNMATLKLNHLHLHLTDDQGWRIEIPRWPLLTEKGSTTAVDGAPGGFYTLDDYVQLVEYAADRHITIVPEIDMPGHTNAALVAYPQLGCDGRDHAPYTGVEVGFSSLCLDSELTYEFIRDVVTTLAEVTPGPYLHMGGDEALTLADADYARFINRASRIVADTGKIVIGWHEMGTATDLLAGIVGQYWGLRNPDEKFVAQAQSFITQSGRMILSPADAVYLDQKYDEDSTLGNSWAAHVSLADAYEWEPDRLIPGVSGEQIFGVEAPIWTETFATIGDVEQFAYPRIAAAAEIAWSPAENPRDFAAFARRLGVVGRQWAARGIHFERVPGVEWQGDAHAS